MYDELDKIAAYQKGKPIRIVGEKIKTTPLDAERLEFLKDKHFYHENDYTDEYVKTNPKSGHRMVELRDMLLSIGGQEVCMPMYEEDLENILDRGQLWLGDRITMMKGLPSQCHLNSTRLWYANKDKVALCTGYALSEDGVWRQHSWCIHIKPRKNRVAETTVERIAYFGFAMTPEEAEEFYDDMY